MWVKATSLAQPSPPVMPIYRSAPDDAEAMLQIQQMTTQITAVLSLQTVARAWLARARAAAEERTRRECAAVRMQATLRGRIVRGWPRKAENSASTSDGSTLPFVVRNLDTGEESSVVLSADEAVSPSALHLGTLQRGTSAWETARLECRGLLEKLAGNKSMSIFSYQLCVWQERYVFAEEDALCYQQLALDRTPTGRVTRIPYASIQFVGPYDESQFVLKCAKRSYTFLCSSADARTRWIRNVSRLAGCSASLEQCVHTTRDKPRRKSSHKRRAMEPWADAARNAPEAHSARGAALDAALDDSFPTDGADGADGANGAGGADGVDGVDGADGADAGVAGVAVAAAVEAGAADAAGMPSTSNAPSAPSAPAVASKGPPLSAEHSASPDVAHLASEHGDADGRDADGSDADGRDADAP